MALVMDCDGISIQQAAWLLRAGQLVAFPTETVYGLGADACNAQAVARIYAAKGRPQFNPLIVHCPDMDTAFRHGWSSSAARRLAQAFWPGPLTLVVKRRETSPVAALCSAGLDSLALRVPSHPDAQALLRACGCPIAAPSANRSGKLSPTRAQHVRASFGPHCPPIVAGASPSVGLESTVVDCQGERPIILRHGGISQAAIEAVLGYAIEAQTSSDRPASPGQLSAHYAPSVPLRLNATQLSPGELWLGFGPMPVSQGLNLSPEGDTTEAAANLFAYLHALDAQKPSGIAVAPIPNEGLGAAINDRLQRAAVRPISV